VPLAPAGGDERPGIVHRLDRDTSGLLLVAKTDEAHAGLVDALRDRRVERRYLAMVDGIPSSPRARIEAPIGRDPRDRLRFAVVAGGREAVTRYVLLAEGAVVAADGQSRPVALLACRLETGRTHQIRVHLSSIGHPVCGDATYRADVRRSRALGLERPFLHAVALALDHPVSGERLELTEPVPDELVAAARDRRGRRRAVGRLLACSGNLEVEGAGEEGGHLGAGDGLVGAEGAVGVAPVMPAAATAAMPGAWTPLDVGEGSGVSAGSRSRARVRKVAIWARVTAWLGRKVPSV
jgi:hypothetical protein